MDFYKKNLQNIRSNRVKLYEKLLVYNDSLKTTENLEIHSVDTRDNAKALIVKKENKEYRMNSIFHPKKEAECYVRKFSFCYIENIIIMCGIGNGILAECVLKNLKENDKLIIYEPSLEIFLYTLYHYDLQNLLIKNNVMIVVNDINEEELYICLQMYIDFKNLKAREIIVHPQYDKVFPEEIKCFWETIKENESNIKTKLLTTSCLVRASIENVVKNLKYLKDCINIQEFTKIVDKEIPIILVAAGPSVEENIEELKRAKGKAIIIAVDRVLKFLLDNGVVPDLVATLDPIKPTDYFPVDYNVKIPLLCVSESNTKLWEKHKGKKIICYAHYFLRKIYIDNKRTPPMSDIGGSVSTMIMGTVVSMGFKTIILVGQDLAYKGQFTHAGEIAEYGAVDVFLDGIDGNKVRSRGDWYIFVLWYQKFILSNPKICVYDTKKEGAKILGTIVKPLNEIMISYTETVNIEKIMKSIGWEFSVQELKSIPQYIKKYIKQLNEIKMKAKEGCKLSDKFMEELEKDMHCVVKNTLFKKEINGVIEFITKYDMYSILDEYITAFAVKELSKINSIDGEEKENIMHTCIASKAIFECIIQACDFVLTILQENRDSIMEVYERPIERIVRN